MSSKSDPVAGDAGLDAANIQGVLRAKHTDALLGPAPQGRSIRIMVTLPTEAAHDYVLVHTLPFQPVFWAPASRSKPLISLSTTSTNVAF